MNKPKAEKPIERAEMMSPAKPVRFLSGGPSSESAPKRKPSGPVIYRVENGADVWPGRK